MEHQVTNTLERIPVESAFAINSFEHAQRVAKMLASSDLVPKEFKGSVQNVMIALEISNRIGASPLMVMQNLYIVHGKPSWSSSFIIAALNACKRFSPLRFELTGEGDKMECYAWAFETSTNAKIVGPTVTMAMAKAEGWIDKNGSKWKTMPQLMIRYRSAAFFGRLYAPEILMGMHAQDEVVDMTAQVVGEEIQPGADLENGITVEALQALYNEKLNLLTKPEMERAKRILENKEVDSYQKLFKFLNEKQAA